MSTEPTSDRRPETVSTAKRLRVFLGGKAVADSSRTLLLRAQGRLPVYYFPEEDVRMEYLTAAPDGSRVAHQGEGPWPQPPPQARLYTVQVGDQVAENAAWRVQSAPEETPDLEGCLAFAWKPMDAWYEEDDQIRVHPHDPYHRIDVRHSSRHVRVDIQGITVAETRRPVLLFETGLPPRFYIPKMDVRMELLALSELTTHCAYKGTAPHYSAQLNGQTVKNVAWYYPFPSYQYAPIQNLVAFYQERVDDFFIEGLRQDKIKTPWS